MLKHEHFVKETPEKLFDAILATLNNNNGKLIACSITIIDKDYYNCDIDYEVDN